MATIQQPTNHDPRSLAVLIEAVGAVSDTLLAGDSWQRDATDALGRLGEAAGVSRVYVFENHLQPDGEVLTSQRFEWAAPEIEPQLDNPLLQSFPLRASGYDRWADSLGGGRPVYGHVRDFPPGEQGPLEEQDIVSILVVPVFVGQEWWGFIGFDACAAERRWARPEIEVLKAAANMLGAAIQRERMVELRRRLSRLATCDELTGLLNRRALREGLEREHAKARRSGRPLSLALLDLDRFKRINDSYGHTVGDRILGKVSRTLEGALRRGDWIGRWGGEEFLCLLPETDGAQASRVMDRVRGALAAQPLSVGEGEEAITASVGIACHPDDGPTLDSLLAAADHALYAAKNRGRNCVVVSSELAGDRGRSVSSAPG